MNALKTECSLYNTDFTWLGPLKSLHRLAPYFRRVIQKWYMAGRHRSRHTAIRAGRLPRNGIRSPTARFQPVNCPLASWHLLPFNGIPSSECTGPLMESMNISLPTPLKRFVDQQIAAGRYSSASEYVRDLIRGDEKRRAEERLEALLLEGLEGEESPLTREDWTAIRKEALSRVAAGKKRV